MTSRLWTPYFILVAAIGLSVATAWYVHEGVEARNLTRFEAATERIQATIADRLETYLAMLLGGKGLFSASRNVSEDEFRAFVSQLELHDRYPGVQGIGYTERVAPEHIARYEIWPKDPRQEYHTIRYLEPLDRRNRRALGYDMYTEPVRRSAMQRARDTGLPAMSGKVTLVQEIDENKQAGFLIYVPLYASRSTPDTIEERRKQLVGFVYSPFRINDLLDRMVVETSEIEFEIYDGTESLPQNLLYVSHQASSEHAAGAAMAPASVGTLEIAGRQWTIAFRPTAAFFSSDAQGGSMFVLGAGLIFAFLLFGITTAQAKARQTAEESAAILRSSEEALRQSVEREHNARTEAETANRIKDEFLATLSHELRTPLTPMLGWAHMLRTREFDKGGLDRGLQIIERNLRTQLQLIEDLLDVSRIITGKLHLRLRPTNLKAAINAALEAVHPAARAKRVRIEADYDSTTKWLTVDPERLQQVVWNLASNAVKFTPAGGLVRVSLTYTDADARIVVSDNGEGISAEFLPHVFDRFRQADSTTTRIHGGLGLGLAIVRYLTELHGGSVEATSPGKGLGSTFTVKLPLGIEVPAASPMLAEPARPGLLRGVRVLVIEDEPDSREFIELAIRDAGAIVTTATGGAQALEIFRDVEPHVVVTDVAMPEMDGFQFVNRMRALERQEAIPPTPVVALTAHARDEDRDRLLAAGFQLHITKPVQPNDLVNLLYGVIAAGQKFPNSDKAFGPRRG